MQTGQPRIVFAPLASIHTSHRCRLCQSSSSSSSLRLCQLACAPVLSLLLDFSCIALPNRELSPQFVEWLNTHEAFHIYSICSASLEFRLPCHWSLGLYCGTRPYDVLLYCYPSIASRDVARASNSRRWVSLRRTPSSVRTRRDSVPFTSLSKFGSCFSLFAHSLRGSPEATLRGKSRRSNLFFDVDFSQNQFPAR